MALLTFICPVCSKTFSKQNVYYDRHVRRHGRDYQPKCSRKCVNISNSKSQQVECLQCHASFVKAGANLKKSPSNHFCSRSCSASYNNRHKMHGTRRSKLEQHLEEQLRAFFPSLPFECNSKTLIGSELDFYFPTLRLAIELNGIFHYEPIYGQGKLDQIVDNDRQKSMRCHETGVEFCVIDTSSCINLTVTQKNKYWNIMLALLGDVMHRHTALAKT